MSFRHFRNERLHFRALLIWRSTVCRVSRLSFKGAEQGCQQRGQGVYAQPPVQLRQVSVFFIHHVFLLSTVIQTPIACMTHGIQQLFHQIN